MTRLPTKPNLTDTLFPYTKLFRSFGYSRNNLSLFGMVLAIGVVVDDAIVVVENVERNLERGLSAIEAAKASMDEVSAALIAIVLVLCAVFVPTLFLTGMSGAFYPQFEIGRASCRERVGQ